jgi:ACS family glucarate transporter-like MFS transporter
MGMFLLSLLLYIDRICISVAKDPIAGDLALTDKQMGWVLSIFALGYALFQVPGGYMADKFGPRTVLTSIVSIWSMLTALTGAAWNFISLLFIRFFFGAGEAGAFPAMSRAIFSWFPLKERGLVIGINFSGSRLGAAFALPLVAWLIDQYSWRWAFAILGIIGIIWAVIWVVTFRNKPEEHQWVQEDELNHIIATRQTSNEAEEKDSLALATMQKSSNVWMVIGQYFCSNFTFFFALSWLFPHLKSKYNLDAMEAGWYAIAPFVFGAIGNWISGIWVDKLFRANRWNASRVIPASLGFFLAAAGLIASVFMKTPLGAVAALSIAIMGADMTLPPSWSVCVDIGKKYAGTVSGTMNMAGNLGSFLTALAFPYLTDWTGSVDYFFYTAAVLNLLAILMWLRIKADRGLAY